MGFRQALFPHFISLRHSFAHCLKSSTVFDIKGGSGIFFDKPTGFFFNHCYFFYVRIMVCIFMETRKFFIFKSDNRRKDG